MEKQLDFSLKFINLTEISANAVNGFVFDIIYQGKQERV